MTTYFITGTSQGIGHSLVHQLSSTPTNKIIATVRTPSPALSALQTSHPNIHILTLDTSSETSINSLKTSIPAVLNDQKIDILINNAAIVAGPETTGLNISPTALHENITTNVLGPALVTSTLLPYLATNALVVNISSGIASLNLVSTGAITARVTAYSISKAALNMLSVHQAYELKGRARVVCLDPGHVKTRLGGDGASVEIEDSAGGVIRVVEGLRMGEEEERDRIGGKARFLNYLGEEVPW